MSDPVGIKTNRTEPTEPTEPTDPTDPSEPTDLPNPILTLNGHA